MLKRLRANPPIVKVAQKLGRLTESERARVSDYGAFAGIPKPKVEMAASGSYSARCDTPRPADLQLEAAPGPGLDEAGHDLGPPLLTESLLTLKLCPRLAVLRLRAPWPLEVGVVVVGGCSHSFITTVLDFEL